MRAATLPPPSCATPRARSTPCVSSAGPRSPAIVVLGAEEAAASAIRQASEEGLTLLTCASMTSGYRGVLKDSITTVGLKNPYRAQVRRDGKRITLGRFGSAAEAALCYTRSPEGQREAAAAATRSRPMTAEEALEVAARDGLTLLPAHDNLSGFQNVGYDKGKFKAYVHRGGRQVHLGRFDTPEEAALCFARSAEGLVAAAATPSKEEESESLRRASLSDATWAADAHGASLAVTTRPQNKKRSWRPLLDKEDEEGEEDETFGEEQNDDDDELNDDDDNTGASPSWRDGRFTQVARSASPGEKRSPSGEEKRARKDAAGGEGRGSSCTVATDRGLPAGNRCTQQNAWLAAALGAPTAAGPRSANQCLAVETEGRPALDAAALSAGLTNSGYSSSGSSSPPASPFSALDDDDEALDEADGVGVGDDCEFKAEWFVSFCAHKHEWEEIVAYT